MKKMSIIFIFISVAVMAGNALAAFGNGKNFKRFDAKAVWNPGISLVQSMIQTCSQKQNTDFAQCFVDQMKKAGATPAATAFAVDTGNQGYMRAFRNFGKVDVAYAIYPFRANENQLCFLVNGSPRLINIDDIRYLPSKALKQNRTYQEIEKRYPKVSIWPGHRGESDGFPIAYDLTGGGQQFIFDYQLRDGCHACRRIGFAFIAFNFDHRGKFLKTKAISVIDTQQLAKDTKNSNIYFKDRKNIRTSSGKAFTIVLDANPTTGYEWQIANPLDKGVIKWVGKEYLPPKSQRPGAGGRAIWSFIAEGSGRADIVFHYIRPWKKQQSPARVRTFNVSIKGDNPLKSAIRI